MIDFIKKVISYKSIESNIEEIDLCMKDFIEHASPSFNYQREYSYRGKPIVVFSTHDVFNFDIIISGHIDVIPGSDNLFTVVEDGNNLYGRGAYDMKAPLVATLFGVMDYLNSSKNNNLKIAYIITADEEVDGLSVKYVSEKLGYTSQFALIPDGGSLREVIVKQKGFWQFEIIIGGVGGHASRPWKSINPFNRLIELNSLFQKSFPDPIDESDWISSVVMTKVIGKADSLNTIPDKIKAYFDMRFVEIGHKKKIKEIIDLFGGNISIKEIAYNGILDININENDIGKIFLRTLKKELKKDISLIKEAGTSDAVFFTEAGTPTILFRPIGGNIHSDKEWVQKKSLNQVRKFIKHFLENVQDSYKSNY